MAQSYAEVAKKNISEDDDATENLHADLQYSQTHTNGIHHELDADENFEATLTRKGDSNTDQSSLDVGSSSNAERSHSKKHTSRGIGKDGSRKVSRGKVALGVAVDIAIAGLVVGWLVKKPSINKSHVGLGTIGLGLFYGIQWTLLYKRLTGN